MKVALLVTHFDTYNNYWEATVARHLAASCDVRVIASTTPGFAVAAGVDAYEPGISKWGNVEIDRLLPTFEWRSRVLARGVRQSLEDFRPDRLVLSAPSQILPMAGVAWARGRNVPFTYVSGEHRSHRPTGKAAGLASLYWNTAGRALIRYSAREASDVVVYTPDTLEMAASATGRSDIRLISLPVDTSLFNYDAASRETERARLGWTGQTVVMYAGKFDERKELPEFVQAFLNAPLPPSTALVLVGSTDRPESVRVASAIRAVAGDRLQILPFTGTNELVDLYRAADLAFFPQVSIGIQQALATGIQVLVPNRSEATHLSSLVPPDAMFTFDGNRTPAGAELEISVRGVDSSPGARHRRAAAAEALSVEAFTRSIVPELD